MLNRRKAFDLDISDEQSSSPQEQSFFDGVLEEHPSHHQKSQQDYYTESEYATSHNSLF